ncbi:hypothetical protein D3D02_12205 [Halobellus sp. Atlit-38R]|uniref:hypothetical protein n=1 Tax=Halobellus sp. Atlit-38R TaxID=2282131 RepID=UPI000EF2243D|nr:hypothetical protein [Halobellus sp. Atlit-38R]RLM88327.1 hypothetical protein D3D02_12205 [Halobellus sp. Atlit-38R]
MKAIGETQFRWRQPEYTGANRCLPCTVVNVAIAGILAIGLASIRLSLGIALLVVGVAAIYFRGYLIPGTPTLTKRYLPDSVLGLFDAHEAPAPLGAGKQDPGDIERFLVDLDVLERCQGGEDLCLMPAFRESWDAQMARQSVGDSEPGDQLLFEGLGVDRAEIETKRQPNAFVAVADSVTIGRWESESAYRADVAADAVLHARSAAWEELDYETRLEVLGALRLWLDQCPDCDGAVTLDEETVESCCRSFEVVAATCDDCGTRLFEAQLSPNAL